MKIALLILLLSLSAFAQPNDDEYWAQRILSAAQVVSARLDHAGRHTAQCIRKARPSMPPLYSSYPYDLKFIVPDDAPQTARVRAARAQAAGTITSAWLRYTGEVNAACIDANQELKFPKIDTQKMYFQILGQ
ncbi:MAG: hypothetical protein J0I12_25470 [Candidatus Eremiobacteraeota bacterium]|nr:hypothetical protein [Candidatus Eremiobacteraeota bacterium]